MLFVNKWPTKYYIKNQYSESANKMNWLRIPGECLMSITEYQIM
jgi:hypothetical protein